MDLRRKYKLNSNFHIFIFALSFLFNSYLMQIHSKPLPERILISNKNILKNNSTLNSKEEAYISNFTFIRKLDNFTNDNDTSNENISDDIINNEETNKNMTYDEINNNEGINMNRDDDETNNIQTKKNDNKTKIEEEPGVYLISFFLVFFPMGVYMICEMKNYENTKNRTDDVWKFLFFANNGALLGSIIDIMISNNTIFKYTPFVLGAIGFVFGSILYSIHYIKECNKEYASHFFSCEKIRKWCELPCFILSFIHLTKECCIIKNENSNTDCAYCCICFWNIFIYFLKIITIFFTFISYYIFVLFLLIFWFIGFLIYNSKHNKQNNDKNNNFRFQTSGNNVTEINSTNNDGVNSTIKNQLENAEAIIVIQNYKLNNEDINNQNTNDPYRKEMEGDNNNNIESSPNYNNIQNFTSQRSFENIKEYFNQPEENKDSKIYMKSINAIQMNFNENIDQNKNKPEISSIHKSNAKFH